MEVSKVNKIKVQSKKQTMWDAGDRIVEKLYAGQCIVYVHEICACEDGAVIRRMNANKVRTQLLDTSVTRSHLQYALNYFIHLLTDCNNFTKQQKHSW